MIKAPDSVDPKYTKFRKWIERDIDAARDWRDEAKDAFDFYAGHQWDDRDVAKMTEENRPVITFELVGPMVRAVSGLQSTNRQQVQYHGRGLEDGPNAEIWTEAARWFLEQNDGADAEDEAFTDCCICGIGFTETRLDYDLHPDGEPMVERVDPYEMGWDHNARKKNLADARRIWRARDMTLGEAKEMFPKIAESNPEQLDARWARDQVDRRHQDIQDRYEFEFEGVDGEDMADDDVVTLIQLQWWESQSFVAMPDGRSVSEDEAREEVEGIVTQRVTEMAAMGEPMPEADAMAEMTTQALDSLERVTKRVYRQAWLGSEILEEDDAPFQDGGFSFKAITGYRDQNVGIFYGIVRAMVDPQRMANKWLSQTLHILNSTAKGGIAAELGAADDQKAFERSWAKSDKITWLAEGGMEKIMPKPVSQFPSGYYELMQFAVSSVRTATGINQEIQGLREANQPGILEDMRKQQSMTTLSALFKALTLYRKQQGRLMLELMRQWVPPERLARIVGDRFAPEQVQAAYQSTAEFDIVVDEMATSPNQKTMVWNMISGIWSSLPPEVQSELWEYAPIPSSTATRIQQAYQQFLGGQQVAPEQAKLDQQGQRAAILKDLARARKDGTGR
jgi:hypothetical protein